MQPLHNASYTLESEGLAHPQSLDVVHCCDRLDVVFYSERKKVLVYELKCWLAINQHY